MKSNETAGEQAPAKRKMLGGEPVRSNLLQGSTHDAVASPASSSSRFRVIYCRDRLGIPMIGSTSMAGRFLLDIPMACRARGSSVAHY